jgi:hypothetical protein
MDPHHVHVLLHTTISQADTEIIKRTCVRGPSACGAHVKDGSTRHVCSCKAMFTWRARSLSASWSPAHVPCASRSLAFTEAASIHLRFSCPLSNVEMCKRLPWTLSTQILTNASRAVLLYPGAIVSCLCSHEPFSPAA